MTISLNIDHTVPFPSNTDPEQAQTLHDILDRCVSEVRGEIAGTESYDMRQDLKQVEQTIKDIRDKLATGIGA